jgi:hypothetical protein
MTPTLTGMIEFGVLIILMFHLTVIREVSDPLC